MTTPHWIAADWGTSNLRIWGIGAAGETLFALTSDKGMSHIGPDEYSGILGTLLAGRLPAGGDPLALVICGMAGARQGWKEAHYLPLPGRLDALGRHGVRPETNDARLAPVILPGLSSSAPGHEDVMRGEETQLLGLTELKPGFDGVVCLPGTHSKWVTIESGTVTRFQTAMTGELFDLLSTRSVLRHALSDETAGPRLEDGISDGLAAGLAKPEQLTALLFRTRAAALLSGMPPDWCRGYLSGLLVGTEIAAHRAWRGGQPVALIGSDRLCRLYASALARDGAEATIINGEAATLAGLTAARRQLLET